MQFTHQGVKIDYSTHGPTSKVPVVFIHGFPFNRSMWQPQVVALEKKYSLVTYDQRGHGQSDVGEGQYSLEFFVDDLIALLDTLHIPKAILCGLSMGGYVALRAMERHPERVQGLVLCDTRSESDTNEAKVKRAASIRTVKEKGVAVFVEGFLKLVFAPATFSEKPEIVEQVRKMMLGNTPLGICGTLLALASRTDTTAALAHMKVPTLIMVGELDPITPPAASQTLNTGIAHSEMVVIPNAAHMSNLENSEAFNRHLLPFLKKATR